MTDDLRERVARAISRHHTIPWENMPDARKKRLLAYADAALAEMGGVRVRELAWVKGTYTTTDDDGGPMEGIVKKLNAWRAGQYTIIRQHGKDGLYIVRGLRQQGVTTVFPTLEAAKDACDRELHQQEHPRLSGGYIATQYIRADLGSFYQEKDIDALLAERDAEREHAAKAEAERDEALRRRDAWREKARHYDKIRDALRAKTAGQDSRTLSKALLGAAWSEAEERAEKAEAALQLALPMMRKDDWGADYGDGTERRDALLATLAVLRRDEGGE